MDSVCSIAIDISVLTDGDSHTSPLHSHKPLVSSKSLHHTNVLSDTKRDDNPTSDGFTPILKPAKASIHDLFQGPYSSPHSIQPGPPPAHHRIYVSSVSWPHSVSDWLTLFYCLESSLYTTNPSICTPSPTDPPPSSSPNQKNPQWARN